MGRTSDVYFDELNVGLIPLLKTRLGTELIEKYPRLPDTIQFHRVTCNFVHKSIFNHPIVTYKNFLPPITDICPILFHDDDIFGLPNIHTIPGNNHIKDQLRESSRTQQYVLSTNNEEPIHAHYKEAIVDIPPGLAADSDGAITR